MTINKAGATAIGNHRSAHIWGWLRLALGWAQMGFAASAMVSLILSGLSEMTWILVGCSTAATLVSRGLYRGRRQPH